MNREKSEGKNSLYVSNLTSKTQLFLTASCMHNHTLSPLVLSPEDDLINGRKLGIRIHQGSEKNWNYWITSPENKERWNLRERYALFSKICKKFPETQNGGEVVHKIKLLYFSSKKQRKMKFRRKGTQFPTPFSRLLRQAGDTVGLF